MYRLPALTLTMLIFTFSSCVTVSQGSPSYPNPNPPLSETIVLSSVSSPTSDISGVFSPTPGYLPTPDIAPELLFTPTPDPNAYSIVAEIEQEYSQEEIAKILFSKWLDHYLNENISPAMRLDEYNINNINIPFEQKCAKKLGGQFVAEAEIKVKATLPYISTTSYERTDWFVAGGGNIIDSYHLVRLFSGVIYQSGNNYRLEIITQIPMCD